MRITLRFLVPHEMCNLQYTPAFTVIVRTPPDSSVIRNMTSNNTTETEKDKKEGKRDI